MPTNAMIPDVEETFLQVLSDAASSVSGNYGLSEAEASELADALTRYIRDRFGGDRVYVHAMDRRELKQQIRREFNGRNREELCARYGISRASFYRLLKDRSLGQGRREERTERLSSETSMRRVYRRR